VVTGVVLMVPEARTITPWAHITILGPFGKDQDPTPEELADVEEFFAGQAPFDFRLTELCRFPGGARYLAPDPAARFSRMTHALHHVFPEYPPYGGEFDIVVPHLAVPDDAVVGPLPVHAHARVATVLHVEDGEYTELASFPFGNDAA
jgi:hypothetical protein